MVHKPLCRFDTQTIRIYGEVGGTGGSSLFFSYVVVIYMLILLSSSKMFYSARTFHPKTFVSHFADVILKFHLK